MQGEIMGYNNRKVELTKCEYCEDNTVHCENKDGMMRCLICGTIKKEEYQILHRMM